MACRLSGCPLQVIFGSDIGPFTCGTEIHRYSARSPIRSVSKGATYAKGSATAMSEVSSTGAFSTVTVVAVWVSSRSWTGSAGAEAQPANAVTIMAARTDTPAQELARIMMRYPG